MSEPIDLASKLIERPSTSPHDEGCQNILRERLADSGFVIHDYSRGATTNTFAVLDSSREGPTLAFVAHTDVVPPGNLTDWTAGGKSLHPFELTERDGKLYGRGIADMKGALAAMVTSTETFLSSATHDSLKGRLAFIITSDEEDDRGDGTQVVTDALRRQDEVIDYALVGEASSVDNVGDRIYVARRGSYHLKHMAVRGLAGHVAKENGIDATEIAVRLMHAGYETVWDENPDPRFPETSFKTWLTGGGFEAENMTSGLVSLRANWRNNPASPGSSICKRFETMAEHIYASVAKGRTPNGPALEYTWALSGEPYATPEDAPFVQIVRGSIQTALGRTPELSGGGGTSDGGVVASLGSQVVELGVQGGAIHEAAEHIPVGALEELERTYGQILATTLSGK